MRWTMDFIEADWDAPPGVRGVATTRTGGVSRPPFASLNLALHVGDEPAAVRSNRKSLREALRLTSEPCWLEQEHGVRVVEACERAAPPRADASVARRRGPVCAVLTADCLPVLLCTRAGDRVAAVHAGWRGLAAGVLESALAALASPPDQVLAWLGPAIGPAAYEVGEEIRARFTGTDPGAAAAFTANPQGRWQADLRALARLRLRAAGVAAISGGDHCTASEPGRFFSYRRERTCGRTATLAWLE